MQIERRPYQLRLVRGLVTDLRSSAGKRGSSLGAAKGRDGKGPNLVVLVSSPASGKTVMSAETIDRLLHGKKFRRALVLTHGQRVIKDNYVETLKAFGSSWSFSFAPYLPKSEPGHVPLDKMTAKVVVALPQSLRAHIDEHGSMPKFDLVIVDEAHHYFYAKE
jgi:superfamily II DNA or RNA helicase